MKTIMLAHMLLLFKSTYYDNSFSCSKKPINQYISHKPWNFVQSLAVTGNVNQSAQNTNIKHPNQLILNLIAISYCHISLEGFVWSPATCKRKQGIPT